MGVSMWDGLLQALGAAGTVLDTPGSVMRGLGSAGVRGVRHLFGDDEQGELALRDLERAATGVFDPERRVYGSEWTGDPWSGMAADMASDPLNLLGGIGLLKGLRAAKFAKANNARRAELLASGGMPEEIAKLTKAKMSLSPKSVNYDKPAKLFHGTGEVYDAFDPTKLSDRSLYGAGYYMTKRPEIASGYAENAIEAGLEWKPGVAPDKFVDSLPPMIDPRTMEPYTALPYLKQLAANDPSGFHHAMQAFRATMSDADVLKLDELDNMLSPVLSDKPANIRMQFLDTRNPLDLDVTLPGDVVTKLNEAAMKRYGRGIGEVKKFGGVNSAMEELAKEGISPLQLAKDAGFDSISHIGGGRTGNWPHRVYIVDDPSQIYSPWIAPAAQQVPRQSPLLAALLGYNAVRGSRDPMGRV